MESSLLFTHYPFQIKFLPFLESYPAAIPWERKAIKWATKQDTVKTKKKKEEEKERKEERNKGRKESRRKREGKNVIDSP